jgi:hypothetical protein
MKDVANVWRTMRRHITDPELVVLAGEEHCSDLAELVRMASAPGLRVLPLGGHGIGGWSNMLEAYRPDLHADRDPAERVLAIGLDTAFVGDSNWLFEWDKAPLGMPCSPGNLRTPCNAVVTFTAEGAAMVWGEYMRAREEEPFPHRYGGLPSEMVTLNHVWQEHKWPLLEGRKMERLVSYKRGGVATKGIPVGCSVVYFHGEPKPRDLPKGDPVRAEFEREDG